jgi:hypothetical protein
MYLLAKIPIVMITAVIRIFVPRTAHMSEMVATAWIIPLTGLMQVSGFVYAQANM